MYPIRRGTYVKLLLEAIFEVGIGGVTGCVCYVLGRLAIDNSSESMKEK